MPAPAFVGDELLAAGFRLAGIEPVVPAAGEEQAAFDAACRRAPVVLIGASIAARIDPSALRERMIAGSPPVAVVPDAAAALPDIAARLRRQLGLEVSDAAPPRGAGPPDRGEGARRATGARGKASE
jgi:vacuolar-type H+-ATPase subunit F/Vma7